MTSPATTIRRAQIALDELPAHSVVLDRHGLAWQKGQASLAYYWYATGCDEHLDSFSLSQRAPFTAMTKGARL